MKPRLPCLLDFAFRSPCLTANEGGPSLIDCFKLLDIQIKKGKMRTQDKIELFKTVVFNFLIGNGDAHGKNFSILYHQNSMILAPRYDFRVPRGS